MENLHTIDISSTTYLPRSKRTTPRAIHCNIAAAAAADPISRSMDYCGAAMFRTPLILKTINVVVFAHSEFEFLWGTVYVTRQFNLLAESDLTSLWNVCTEQHA